jgi:hypothetical protein
MRSWPQTPQAEAEARERVVNLVGAMAMFLITTWRDRAKVIEPAFLERLKRRYGPEVVKAIQRSVKMPQQNLEIGDTGD